LASVTTGATTLSVDDSNTFSRAAGSFVADGFQTGMKVDTSGFSNVANNGTFTIAGVTATTIDVEEATLIPEVGDGDESMTSIGEVTLFLGMPFVITPGDKISIYRGCNKSISDCSTVFDNVVNYRGEPYVPGTDILMRSPDAPQG
jgi:uncharacterized phage protein (TIGR02218 family)